MQRIADKYGWFIAAYYWFGWRNRAHGFDSLWSRPAPGHWPHEVGMNDNGEQFYWRGRYSVFGKFEIHLSFGWAVYASTRHDTGFEFRPQMAIKTRRPKPADVTVSLP